MGIGGVAGLVEFFSSTQEVLGVSPAPRITLGTVVHANPSSGEVEAGGSCVIFSSNTKQQPAGYNIGGRLVRWGSLVLWWPLKSGLYVYCILDTAGRE